MGVKNDNSSNNNKKPYLYYYCIVGSVKNYLVFIVLNTLKP